MERSYLSLPEGYSESGRFDLDNDKKLAVRVNMNGLITMLPFAVVLLIMYINGGGVSFDMNIQKWLFFMFAAVIAMLLHEAIHGLFFKIFAPKSKVKFGAEGSFLYAGNPDVYYSKAAFIVIGLSPAVLITLALAASLFFLDGSYFYIFYMVMAIHFGGCVGDFMAAITISKLPKDVLVCDTGLKMTYYTK